MTPTKKRLEKHNNGYVSPVEHRVRQFVEDEHTVIAMPSSAEDPERDQQQQPLLCTSIEEGDRSDISFWDRPETLPEDQTSSIQQREKSWYQRNRSNLFCSICCFTAMGFGAVAMYGLVTFPVCHGPKCGDGG